MGSGVGVRELLVVAGLATAGLILAAVAALSPWYSAPPATRTPIVTVIDPGGVADGR
ncbi:hypothetical protein [Rugosimonospora africana]|uniref:Uncharacterized protein n=1 Tax=Rugosimonospora africana TaxID=556532 RepID=A0A8J3VNY9_9ACTN|nr:hypothetical protein [Rugosimonospora africana]GIH12718.1 hypothetical protein Raf01_08900 [Rugosimonospora africana]